MGLLIPIALIIILFIFYKKFRKNNFPESKYSFGLSEAEHIYDLLKQKKYDETERVISKLSTDNLTQTVDHISLSFPEKLLSQWLDSSTTDIPKLFLGSYYLHQAWIARSGKLASKVSEKSFEKFHDFLLKSNEYLEAITTENENIATEKYSRLIRVNMGLSEPGLSNQYFEKAIEINPNILWAYIHHAEIIQPKWFGSDEEIQNLLENLPENSLIKQAVELKLISDSHVISDNYFKYITDDLDTYTLERITAIDKELTQHPPTSIHKFIVYNYMHVLAETVNDKPLKKKYSKLMGFNYTLYPYGVSMVIS